MLRSAAALHRSQLHHEPPMKQISTRTTNTRRPQRRPALAAPRLTAKIWPKFHVDHRLFKD